MSMRKKSIVRTMAAAAVFAAALSGCDTQKAKAPLNHSTDGRESVTLTFTYWGSEEERSAIEGATKAFTDKYPWIAVRTIQLPGTEYNSKLVAMAAANDLPDIGYMNADLGEIWANEGMFVDLYDMFARDSDIRREDYLDALWYRNSPDSAWGISTAGETFGLFYRRDLLEEAGVAAPGAKAANAWSWEAFVAAAQRLTLDKSGRNAADPLFDPKSIKQYGVIMDLGNELMTNFIFNNEGDWLSEDGKRFTLNQPEAAQAIQQLADLIQLYHVMPSPRSTRSLPELNLALESGLTAMAIGGQWMNLELGKANVKYDIGVLPKLKRSVALGLSGATVIFKNAKHPEEAWLLFKWLSNPDNAIELYSSGLWMPTLKKWYTDASLVAKWVDANPAAHPPGFKDAMLEQYFHYSAPGTMYYMTNYAKIKSIVMSGLEDVWLGRKTAQEALDEIAPAVQPEIRGRKDIR